MIMKSRVCLVAILVAGNAAAFGPAVISWTGGSQFSSFYGSLQATPDMVGFRFNVSTDLLVTELGFWGDTSGGQQASHEVMLWRQSDAFLMGQATVAPGAPVDTFGYTAVSPILLTAGVDYVVAADYWTGGPDAYVSGPTSATYDPLMTHVGASHPAAINMGYVMPTTLTTSNRGRFGPNMTLAAVPEPASFAVLGLGAAALLRRRRQR